MTQRITQSLRRVALLRCRSRCALIGCI
jgi:hypothetical protein